MKKILLPITLSIVLGFIAGKFYVNLYSNDTTEVFKEGEKTYFIDLGVKETIDKNSNFLYQSESDGYHLYVGITKNEEIALKIKDYYSKNENNVNVVEKYITNDTFNSLLDEYEKVLSIANDEDIIKIEKIIISNYKEMIQTT